MKGATTLSQVTPDTTAFVAGPGLSHDSVYIIQTMFERPQSGERAVLVHVDFPGESDPEDLLEFTELASSAGAQAIATVTASRKAPDPRFYIGSR